MKITEMLISKKVNLADSEEELKSLLMKMKEESKKVGLIKIMTPVPSLHGK